MPPCLSLPFSICDNNCVHAHVLHPAFCGVCGVLCAMICSLTAGHHDGHDQEHCQLMGLAQLVQIDPTALIALPHLNPLLE
eukprot:12426659-Karenia_brevis.AAC.1